MKRKYEYILSFEEISKEDIRLVGGKGANLGEMVKIGLSVPKGFAVTVKAYFEFLRFNHLETKIKDLLSKADNKKPEKIRKISQKIKKLILESPVPQQIAKEIVDAYWRLGGRFNQAYVAIRSSATAEDLPGASFAGQQVSFLNVKGEANVVEAVRSCWASLFEGRAIFYRQENKFDHFKVGIAVPVQEMVQSRVSGVMFTIDPMTDEKNKIVIEAVYGLGETIVQGEEIPDRYVVDSNSFKILIKEISHQINYLVKVGDTNKKLPVPRKIASLQKIPDKMIKEIARYGQKIHRHYYFPQDIEWAVTDKGLFFLQTRPVTTISPREEKKSWEEVIKKKPILVGQPASPGIATGKVRIVFSPREIGKVEKGDVLVSTMTKPDFVPAMKRAVAIITDLGGQTSHAAIVSRELGVPCVVGTKEATKILKNGDFVTVHGKRGEVYLGSLQIEKVTFASGRKVKTLNKMEYLRTATKIYVNLAEPEIAASIAQKNVDGVGLLRAEFMIAKMGVHPKLLIKERKKNLFIDQLVKGMEEICRAFHPRPVVYRATDFKTNEYRDLKGGKEFEPLEANPFIGFRGASRYIRDSEVFEMELEAIKRVRNKIQLKNLWLMIPFVRTPEELREVKKIIFSAGLVRSPTFCLWLMVEIPSNVILLEDFIKVGIDGVSIGSNDLTMLVLGADRDNETLANLFDERNPAVLWALEKTIKTCQRFGVTCSICGQAVSSYPDLVRKLVEWGITSVSISPDKIEATKKLIFEAEKDRILKKKGEKD